MSEKRKFQVIQGTGGRDAAEREPDRADRESYRSILSVGSVGSILSVGSAGSIASVGSAGSIASVGSAGSIASVGSIGSVASLFSIGSRNSFGAVFNVPIAELWLRWFRRR